MRNTIKITNEAKDALDWLKSNYSFTNFSIAIETTSNFFKHNNINPREVFINNFSNSIFELKKELSLKIDSIIENENKNTERVIKLNRRIEEDILKPSNKKLSEIHLHILEEHNTKHNENLIKESKNDDNKSIHDDKILELNKLIEQQDKSIKDYKNIVEKQDKEIKEFFRCMKALNQSMKVENSTFGKKIFINLPLEDAEALFHLIP